jgi:glutaredoxin-like YruB-family protein
MMVNVKVYSTTTCPWCTKVKEFLKENNIKFKDINISEDEKARNEIIEKSGQMGVPIIEIGNKIIVGFDESKIRKALKL